MFDFKIVYIFSQMKFCYILCFFVMFLPISVVKFILLSHNELENIYLFFFFFLEQIAKDSNSIFLESWEKIYP